MHYTISYQKPHQHFIDIRLTVHQLTSSTTYLQLPSWRPGRYEMGNFAKNIQKFRITDGKGNPLQYRKVTKDRWEVQTEGLEQLVVDYNYYATQMDAGGSYLDDEQLYINFINCLIFAEDRLEKSCRVELKIPADYQVACGLQKAGTHTLIADNYYILVDSPMIASNSLEHKSYTVGNTAFHIWVMGNCRLNWEKALKDFQGFSEAQVQAMGGFPIQQDFRISLTWEKQQSINLGLDAGFFKERLRITVDHFRSRNTDLLLRVNLPDISGFSTALTNIGEVKNTGWEFLVSTVNFANEFQWSTDFNLSTYQNEVVKLGPKGDPIISSTHITQIGQPIGMFYGLLTDGIFETQAELDEGPLYAPGSSAGTHLGDIKFVDLSGPEGVPDGIIDSYDRTIMGSAYPDFYYGMTNRFSFKNFSLSVSLQGVQGNQVLSQAKRVSMRGEFRVNQLAVLNNFWKSEEDPGDSPRPNDEPTGGIRSISERFLDEGSYLRINNVSLGYLVPNTLSQKLKLQSLRIYLNATNPFLFTKNLGFNPDVSNSDNALTPGVDNNLYPLAKSLLLGLNVSF